VNLSFGMRLTRWLLLGALLSPGIAVADEPDGRTQAQRVEQKKTDKAAEEGALQEKADPRADLKQQKANLARLRQNASDDRKAGNRACAWTAECDARHVEKLIRKTACAIWHAPHTIV
jgi:hypothetical protein